MHAPRSFGVAILFLSCVLTATTYPTTSVYPTMNAPKKCCIVGHVFNEDVECVQVESEKLNYTTRDIWQTVLLHPSQTVTVIAPAQSLNCRRDNAGKSKRHFLRTYIWDFYVPTEYCVEKMINGTVVLAKCPESTILDKNDSVIMTIVTKTTTTTITNVTTDMTKRITMTTTTTTTTTTKTMTTTMIAANASSDEIEKEINNNHGGLNVIFWGAQTYMDTNVAHVILCIIVVAIYLFLPELGRTIHNRAVLRHNICLLALGCILTFLGYCDLRECPVDENFIVFVWIALQYFTNATGFWLNVICFDMTLSITRFRWIIEPGQRTSRGDNKRLLLYGAFAWGIALIPAVVAIILEYYPGIPEDFPLKPNYRNYHNGPNIVVNLYFFGIPLLTLFWNNVLFVFTTYKIICIQRSTEIATRNQTNALKKKYFLFLQMYLLMGAPWFFGSLLACMNQLVVLKICRLTQPALWLLMLATHKKLRQKLISKLQCCKRRENNATNS